MVILPAFDQRFSVTNQSDAFYFCLQCRKSIQDTLEYPLIIIYRLLSQALQLPLRFFASPLSSEFIKLDRFLP